MPGLPGTRAGGLAGAAAILPPPPSGTSLATGSGRTVAGAGVVVSGAGVGSVEAGGAFDEAFAGAPAEALAGALADALANAVGEDDVACAVCGASFSCPLPPALTLPSSLASLTGSPVCSSGWFTRTKSSALLSSSSTLPVRVIPEGLWEIFGSRTCETDDWSSIPKFDAR